jgi:hypothetical protein
MWNCRTLLAVRPRVPSTGDVSELVLSTVYNAQMGDEKADRGEGVKGCSVVMLEGLADSYSFSTVKSTGGRSAELVPMMVLLCGSR